MIPEPLKALGDEIRLIKLQPKSKEPVKGESWPVVNYDVNSTEILQHIQAGNNYGYFTKTESNLCVLDADKPELLTDLLTFMGKTLTVKSGRVTNGYHLIFRCDDFPKTKISLDKIVGDEKIALGDIRRNGDRLFYLVAPGSIHPDSGNRYEIIDDSEPALIYYNELSKVIEPWVNIKKIKKQAEYEQKAKDVNRQVNISVNRFTDRSGLRIEDIAFPDGEIAYRSNGDLQGAHPVHGSETGENFSINPVKNCWHCYRHNSGGDPALLLAVKHGIISCEQAEPGILDNPAIMKKLEEIILNEPEYSRNGKILKETKRQETEKWKAAQEPVKEHQQPGTLKPDYEDVSHIPSFVGTDIKNLKFSINLPESHLIRRYVEHWKERTDAYPDYHYASALTLLSVACNRVPRINLMNLDIPIFPNLWCLLLGSSGSSRKTTAISPVKRILGANERFKVAPAIFSTEALIEHFAESPRSYMIKDESGQLFQSINNKRYASDSRDILCLLYDCADLPPRKLTSKKNEKSVFTVTEPYPVIFGSTTQESLLEHATKIDATSGLLYRFLLIHPQYEKKNKPLEIGTSKIKEEINEIANDFNNLAKTIGYFKSISMVTNQDCLNRLSDWKDRTEKRLRQDENIKEMASSMLSRIEIYVLKLAMLLTLGDEEVRKNLLETAEKSPRSGSNFAEIFTALDIELPIPDTYMAESVRIVDEYLLPVALDVVGSIYLNENRDVQSKILNILKKSNGCWMFRKDIIRATRLRSKELTEHIDSLIESGEVVSEFVKVKAGNIVSTDEKGQDVKMAEIIRLVTNNNEKLDKWL